jgi:hypothetical protein
LNGSCWTVALAGILAGAFACEGEYRPYHRVGGADASPVPAPQIATPTLNPAPAAGAQPRVGDEPTNSPSPVAEALPDAPVVDAPQAGASAATGDAGAASAGDCDCSRTPTTPFCRTTAEGNSSFPNTCVACLSNADCLDPTPRCDQAVGQCSTCQANQDCASTAGKPICSGGPGAHCVECMLDADCTVSPAGSLCNTATNRCVRCIADADCPEATASRCADGQCQPCTNDGGDSHCGHVVNGNAVLGVCDEAGAVAVCVQCTGTQSAACGANICNSLTRACSPFPAGTAGTCQPCISDANCAANSRCVLETFGQSTLGYACVPLARENACPLTPFSGLTRVNTIDGAVADVCRLRRTTCAGFLGALQPCAVDSDCGEPNLDDGRCVDATGTGSLVCSIPCANGADCPSNDNQACTGACRL